ncbi:MAG: nucleoside-diphosphate kinase [Candidatus Levybacteria bacterium CG10_big_fil_rev_8_21_14_0_10_36_7]|nr:MAG: nucleoside-diphosphate kinase [Candidatus Levybacteria bacterium CG10_big_fil_rev_8_21_14_0_10_36_7]
MEQTVVLVKPDGVQRGLIGEIIHRFERKGLRLSAVKMVSLSDDLLDEWYVHHKDKPFFPGLKSYMKSYPIVAMVWEGVGCVATVRKMIGVTLGRDADPGTIRGDFAMSQQYNLIHASESSSAARDEIRLMFSDDDIFSWGKEDFSQIYAEEERK